MESSRLLRILLLLQLRGRMSAQDLSEELEVSVRTIYRDMEALGMAGVPVYADTGPGGGYRLIEGWRTELTGLTFEEAESLFLTGLPGPAAELGLGAVVAATELKLASALPPELRGRATRIRERFHLDAPGWFEDTEPVTHLAPVAEAVWRQRRVHVRYRRWKGEVQRDLDPLGIVLKGGLWYLVARAEHAVHTYRVSRILELDTLDEHFERPDGFVLADFWSSGSEGYESAIYASRARVRLSPTGLERLPMIMGAVVDQLARAQLTTVNGKNWVEVELPVESSISNAANELLRFGPEVEVLEPKELRAAVAAQATAVTSMYSHEN
jgi:predicted DNA-binding transcriptional regulator YafY